ncbi:Oxidoreductase cicC [Psilocybe cubensis]|uniref:Oxidoreductase cicC n=2 Tax=Psilocybe cubensis TaxID=181762 RepID=A0ACB8GST9_PSICU|nr:Oxidoreductase cicC [Psilocybe cubensis]KAH9478588.1 Oxidoreductase cicC [Psilocybe cubensis]
MRAMGCFKGSLSCLSFIYFLCWHLLYVNAASINQREPRAANDSSTNTWDYIIVGSGPGGGPLAARLAQAGFSVLLVDAGDDNGDDDFVRVPALNAQASEYTPIHWQFFVSHYDDPATAQRDSKFTWKQPDGRFFVGPNPPAGSEPLGIYYPRTGTLGGCAEHNAMVMIYPAESDWNNIATITGDSSWSAANMRQFWEKLENNQYVLPGTSGHGFAGWLDTSLTSLNLVLKDTKVLSLVQGAATAMGQGLLGSLLSTLSGLAQVLITDLNNDSPTRDTTTGLYQVPISVSNGPKTRSSQRKLILDTANAVNADGSKQFKLDIELNTLVTRVIFDTNSTSGTPRAIGVEYLQGSHLYRADPNSDGANPTGSGTFFANREVILSGGTFNTPQLLKLSGIGPADELSQFDIPVVLDSPAVGTNMQDRYEVGVVGSADSGFVDLAGCTFLNTTDDPCFIQWRDNSLDHGLYASNGYALGIVQQTSVSAPTEADIIIAGVPANFHGYFPGYSNRTNADSRHWTWLVLKAHSRNNAGTVTLRSSDPRDTPQISFKSYTVGGDLDAQASFEGVQLARKMFKSALPLDGFFTEEIPGPAIQSEADVKQWIRDEAWGHHASCSVPIGADDDITTSVLDSKFRVKGVSGLRVVDASVFPNIPSLYIVAAVYMISEKAAATIIQDAQ